MKRELALAVVCFGAARSASAEPALRWGGDPSGGGPYIFEGPDGKQTGFEEDLARHLAGALGRQAEFVYGDWGRLPYLLDRGTIDLVLNGYEWSAEREEHWASTIPYYVYRLQLLGRANDASLASWEDLIRKGAPRRRVGVLGGSAAERYLAEPRFRDTVEVLSYPDVTRTLQLVRDGQLDAALEDAPAAIHYAKEYPELRPIGDPVAPGYYVAFVRRTDRELKKRLDATLLAAMKDGTLERIYRKYGIWDAEQARLVDLAGRWPPTGASDAVTKEVLLGYGRTLIAAALVTVELACLSMPIAILLGIAIAIGRIYAPRWVSVPLAGYVELLRGTPILFQLFVIYYLLPHAGIRIPELWAGVLGLALNYSAYEAENYRAGLLAIPRGQMEAALALGMSTPTALRRVIVPQAMRLVLPPVTNDFISLFKDTSVCSVIAVTELSNTYNRMSNDHPGAALELGLLTAVLYLSMSVPLSLVARRLERR